MKTVQQFFLILVLVITILVAVSGASLLLFSDSDLENFYRYNSLGLQLTGLLIVVSALVNKLPSMSGVTIYVPSTHLPELTPTDPMPWKEDIERKIRNIQTHLEELESHVEAMNKAASHQRQRVKRMVKHFYAYWRFEITGLVLLIIGLAMNTLSPELASLTPDLNYIIQEFSQIRL